ncbi:hypothetical protein PROFUN_16210 [Planoprotostelium fungivorum]|uniref:Uncharacterized protein n=1 Tax=Planoprotostelium fungivorum TaxID=1890364 RepID=A0A2P6MRN4_9EUKA|nr:hypothetical protein PROFUN_16210 [Planoprotostelium fungivorum]
MILYFTEQALQTATQPLAQQHELCCCNHPWAQPYVIDLLFVFVPLTFLKLSAIVQPNSLLLFGGNQNAPSQSWIYPCATHQVLNWTYCWLATVRTAASNAY